MQLAEESERQSGQLNKAKKQVRYAQITSRDTQTRFKRSETNLLSSTLLSEKMTGELVDWKVIFKDFRLVLKH